MSECETFLNGFLKKDIKCSKTTKTNNLENCDDIDPLKSNLDRN